MYNITTKEKKGEEHLEEEFLDANFFFFNRDFCW